MNSLYILLRICVDLLKNFVVLQHFIQSSNSTDAGGPRNDVTFLTLAQSVIPANLDVGDKSPETTADICI